MRRLLSACLLVTALIVPAAAPAIGEEMHHHEAAACADPGLACASVATPLFGRDGTLWLAWIAAGRVSVARSTDHGRSFAPAVLLGGGPERLDAGGDGRPALAEDGAGHLLVAYARFKDDQWNSQALLSRSIDGGASFSPPAPLSADAASQRFPTLASDGQGHLFAAWIDKRTASALRDRGQPPPGAALAFAWSDDGGASFSGDRVFHDGSCECCRLAVALTPEGRPAVLFRSLFDGGIRDHAVITFADRATPGPALRVSEDDWAINGCPHHGPALAIGAEGIYHAAWFTQGPHRQGLFYARSADGGHSFSPPLALSTAEAHPARPAVLARGEAVWLAWKEFDGGRTTVRVRSSADGGLTWSAPRGIAETSGPSDHPLLVTDGAAVFLSWLTRAEGYRLLPLEDIR